VIGSVRAGGGLAVLPRSYLELAPGARGLSLLDLPEKFRRVEIYLIVQRWKFPMRLLNAFVQSCLPARVGQNQRLSKA
jgi:DNA-binding transcriptional LysR family regulator